MSAFDNAVYMILGHTIELSDLCTSILQHYTIFFNTPHLGNFALFSYLFLHFFGFI